MAQKGTSTFVLQRMTAVLMLPLVAWFLWSVIAYAGGSYADAYAWAGEPLNSLLLGAFVTVGAVHMRIGLMEVIHDYIHGGLNNVLNVLNWIVAIGAIAVTWWSLFQIAF